ncbi:hypothetical protein AB205_0149320 [Aquarana catesbeiana]|uniref:Uncharacterized protein n=1 Tax=Aquarana catesbeiana TaxID=8400 RepID=A0A2G9QJ00_AQUCT|nr:hypothetical protein AB205_0149320 [Aquarana catesbeiana]
MSTASGGKKNLFSRNRVSHGRGHNSSSGKPAQSPPATREKDLFAVLCGNHLVEIITASSHPLLNSI